MSATEIPAPLLNQYDAVLKTNPEIRSQRLFGLANPKYQATLSARSLRRASKKLERQAHKRNNGDSKKYAFKSV